MWSRLAKRMLTHNVLPMMHDDRCQPIAIGDSGDLKFYMLKSVSIKKNPMEINLKHTYSVTVSVHYPQQFKSTNTENHHHKFRITLPK